MLGQENLEETTAEGTLGFKPVGLWGTCTEGIWFLPTPAGPG